MRSSIKYVSILIVSLIIVAGCAIRKSAEEPLDFKAYFIVGEGGGFAGTYIQYRINQSGSIEEFDFESYKYNEIAKVSPAEVDGFFSQIEEMNLGEIELSSPGNMSRYIEINYMGINDHKLIWAMESESIQPEILSFFTDSFSFCKKLSE